MKCVELKPGKKDILFLVPELAMDRIKACYLDKLKNIPEEAVAIMQLLLEEKKTSAVTKKQFIRECVLPFVHDEGIRHIIVTDGEYFKTLAGKSKVDVYLGYEVDCKFTGKAKVMYVPNFFRIFYQPDIEQKIDFALSKLNDIYAGKYQEPGKNIIHSAVFTDKCDVMKEELSKLYSHPELTADIETFSLKHNDAGIASIAFAWDEHNGVAFQIDSSKVEKNLPKRKALKNFLENYHGRLIWHNIAFDAYILVCQLWMKDQNDMEGLLAGLDVMTKNFEDTKLIAYLALNSCSRTSYKLKELSQEFAGNYAQEEIGDVSNIPAQKLLEYNLTDALATYFVYNKYFPKMRDDNQLEIYEKLFKPAIKDIIQMQLTGLPIDLNQVEKVKRELLADKSKALDKIMSSLLVQKYEVFLNEAYVQKMNGTWKTKRITIADAHEKFNPMSSTQVADLLFSFCGLVPTKFTQTNQPSVDSDAIFEIFNKTDDPEIKNLLEGILELSGVEKILTAFIPAFEKAIASPDGWHWLCGNFNLGGTISGRLSSNNPNLQNLPATGTKYAKLIKSCFKTPKNKLFIGLDFASLEDRISALTTKDSNKLKVYTDHYDGHCLRAFFYFQEQMPDIKKEYEEAKDEDERVKIINSIKSRYKELRQASKGPTFALTYAGNWRTLMNKFKFSMDDAKRIERRYHELYKESDDWVKERINKASKDGFVTAAFGLRVRTPLLAQSLRGTRASPKEVDAEARSAGNALGQSWCLLNSRAASEFMAEVRSHPVYKTKIRPCAQIHDAQYYVIDDDIDLLLWINERLVHAVQWQEHPDIAHDQVKLGGNLSLFFPDWAHEIELPNGCSREEFIRIIKEGK